MPLPEMARREFFLRRVAHLFETPQVVNLPSGIDSIFPQARASEVLARGFGKLLTIINPAS
jgi:hypothetical protein